MQRIARALGRFLGEETMGLLALSALALALAPFFFELSAEEHRVLRGFEWAVVGVFALEYVVDLVLAPAMVTYVLDPWRLLDLAIIGAPVAGLFLPESNTLNASPALRLLRVVFILGVGARMRSRVTSTVAD